MTVAQTSTTVGNRLRWGRVIVLAVSLEAALFVTLVPLQPLIARTTWLAAVGFGCVLFGYIAGRLVARGLRSQAVRHGLLVGMLATIIYLVICALAPGGVAAAVAAYGAVLFVLLNALRIGSCMAGAIHSNAHV